jgi:hypothetical protein
LAKQKFNGRGWKKKKLTVTRNLRAKEKNRLQPGRYNGQNRCKGPKTGRCETVYEMASTIAG